ncbi:MAG: hypothetical protein JWO64_3274 [Hyphomicrobiales bacterium]|nr:hypothetical protein [Hyphomicrobiales bacterium]
MNLQDLAAFSTALSGIGVIFTVIYAALQIRNNTREVRATAFQQVVNSFAAISFDIAKDKTLSALYLRGGRDLKGLDEVEQAQYMFMLLSFLRRAEAVFFQTETHNLHEQNWFGIRESTKSVMASAGARACWSEIRTRFNPQFAEFIDELAR